MYRGVCLLDDSRSGACWAVGPLQDNASWMPQPVDCSPFLAGSVVLWHSGFWSVAASGLRRVSLSRTSLKATNRSTACPSCQVLLSRARHTGSRQLSPSSRFFVAGIYCSALTDPPGDVPGCGRDKVRNKPPWLSRVMPFGPQLPVPQFGDFWCPNFERLDVAILLLVAFPQRCLRLDFLLLTCCSRAAGWLGSLIPRDRLIMLSELCGLI